VSRPAVTVVMPFAGGEPSARAALAALRTVRTGPDDERILVDNTGCVPDGDGIRVIVATDEQSPAYARNVGAEHANGAWILFLDADVTIPADLLERYFATPVGDHVGALAGGVRSAPGGSSLAARYGAAKGFLSQDAHMAHAYLPRAVAANLLVRRTAFQQVGGFFEGVRAAEDTDFSWRLQRAGWDLEGRPDAAVEHRYRDTVRALRRQWRGYAAGRAWLGRRYEDFRPEPALRRAATRVIGRHGQRAVPSPSPTVGTTASPPPPRRIELAGYRALDAVLGLEELAGLALSNRPRRSGAVPTQVVLVADRFPGRGDPLVDFAVTLTGARVEASARPEAVAPPVARELRIDYREDDGALQRAAALARLAVRHPLRSASDVLRRRPGDPGLAAVAPAVARLRHDAGARVHPLGGADARALAERLARLSGRRMES
jgi:Glycosyl transferase family group 2